MRFWRRKPEGTDASQVGVLELTAEERREVHEQTERATDRSRRGILGRLAEVFARPQFDESLWDELEEILILADTGAATAGELLARVRQRAKAEGVRDAAGVRELLRQEMVAVLEAPARRPPAWALPDPPSPLVILVVGVNGSGKTTTIGKLAQAFRRDGAKVVLGAADTFRAAAIDQLRVWAERIGVRLVAQQPGSDPGAVAYDAVAAAEAEAADVVIIDTAGRLHTKTNLMEELRKVARVVQRRIPEAPHEVLLVLDATTGQNGLAQARTFTEAVGVTGIVLTKLDGTAKGGIAFAIAHDLGLPVRFIGTGERADDLAPFDAREFVGAILP
ncbi:Signal recognition particle receptor FtsY [bacterium HR29]|nr:Signal recognition particle receptor FtsY [bacterium HR29]